MRLAPAFVVYEKLAVLTAHDPLGERLPAAVTEQLTLDELATMMLLWQRNLYGPVGSWAMTN